MYLPDLDSISTILNLLILTILFFYSFYLYRTEKNIRLKYKDFEEKSRETIVNAQETALKIITKSEYLSNSIKNEINENFDNILEHLRSENVNFYKTLQHDYISTEKDFVAKIITEEEKEMSDFKDEIKTAARDARSKLEKSVEDEYQKIHEELYEYKESKQKEVFTDFEDRFRKAVFEVMPDFISIDSQKALLRKAMRRVEEQSGEPV